MLGLFQSEKDGQFIIRGIICLGSKPYEEFENAMKANNDFEEFKIHKVNTAN